jgi:hypothetical protein
MLIHGCVSYSDGDFSDRNRLIGPPYANCDAQMQIAIPNHPAVNHPEAIHPRFLSLSVAGGSNPTLY